MILPVRLSTASVAAAPASASVVASVDTTVPYLFITEDLALQLHLQQIDTRLVRDADGHESICPYMGPLVVEARGVKAHMGAIVYGDAVVLGNAALSALGLVADERHGKVYTDGVSPRVPSLRTI